MKKKGVINQGWSLTLPAPAFYLDIDIQGRN
jgi:hypothetical protein